MLKTQTEGLEQAIGMLEDGQTALEMAAEDEEFLAEADETLYAIEQHMEKVELQSLLSGKHDHRNCFFTIQAGAGGTEANDWAEMIVRMYLYFFERREWKVEEISRSHGTEVGISEVSYHVKGPMAYGYLISERGTPPRPGQPVQRGRQAADLVCHGGCDSGDARIGGGGR